MWGKERMEKDTRNKDDDSWWIINVSELTINEYLLSAPRLVIVAKEKSNNNFMRLSSGFWTWATCFPIVVRVGKSDSFFLSRMQLLTESPSTSGQNQIY